MAHVLNLIQACPPTDQRDEAAAEAVFAIANLCLARGARETAHELYTMLIETAPACSEVRWQSYTNRGVVELGLGDRIRGEADFAAVISSPDASDESRACCLNNRADLRAEEGDHLGAIADRTAVLQLQETSYNRRYIALARRAVSLRALERFEEADEDVEAILSTTDIAVEQKMAARLMRAEWAADIDAIEIVEAELEQVMTSRRNFPHVTKAAAALAGKLGMLDRSIVATADTCSDEGGVASISEP